MKALPHKHYLLTLFFLINTHLFWAQKVEIKGVIIDASTQEPLMSATVYFSGTSTGVVTGVDGSFSIPFTPEINAPLVIASLGFEKQQFADPMIVNSKKIELKPETNQLDAVVLDPDPWSRATKEDYFRQYFIGRQSLETSSIINLDQVRLRFNPSTSTLTATARVPIRIVNKELGYMINYDLAEFELLFSTLDTAAIKKKFNLRFAPDKYHVESSFVSGTSFYGEMDGDKPSSRQRERRRSVAYRVSQLKFYRALASGDLEKNKFRLFYNGMRVPSEEHIRVHKEKGINRVVFRHLKYTILDRSGAQTDLYLKDHNIYIDNYGNNLSPRAMLLSGYIPQLGVGGMMPLDYGLESEELD